LLHAIREFIVRVHVVLTTHIARDAVTIVMCTIISIQVCWFRILWHKPIRCSGHDF